MVGARWSCGRGAVVVWQGRGGRVVGARWSCGRTRWSCGRGAVVV